MVELKDNLQILTHLRYTVDMRKLFSSVVFFCLLAAAFPTYAAPTPTIDIQSVSPYQTCDICGGCWDGETQTFPPDYNECKACIEQADHKWTIFGCMPTSLGGFVQTMLQVVTSVVGGVAFLAMLYGGFLILTSAGNAEQLNAGKSILMGAIGGVILVVFAVFILEFIGITIFGLPGFGGG